MAPYESDAQLAYLVQSGYADLVITEDSDLLMFGCKQVSLSIFIVDLFKTFYFRLYLSWIYRDLVS